MPKTDLVDILKEIGKLLNQQKRTNQKLDEINQKLERLANTVERTVGNVHECESKQSGESAEGNCGESNCDDGS